MGCLGECNGPENHTINECPSLKAYMGGKHGMLIAFDLETTGLEKNSDILEIAACPLNDPGKMFQTYVLPSRDIHPAASKKNKFTVENGALHYDGKRVKALHISEALTKFVNWLKENGGFLPILVAHYCRGFDAKVLLNSLYRRANPETRQVFIAMGVKFADSFPLLKDAFPGMAGHSYPFVYERIFDAKMTGAHQARADVTALVRVLKDEDVQRTPFKAHVFDAWDLVGEMNLR